MVSLKEALQQQHVLELLAYGLSDVQKPYYTIRDSITNADQTVIDEVPDVFGCSWSDLKAAALAHCDLDKKYYPVTTF